MYEYPLNKKNRAKKNARPLKVKTLKSAVYLIVKSILNRVYTVHFYILS